MNLSNHGSRNQESLFLIDGHNTSQMESVGGANNVFRISASYVLRNEPHDRRRHRWSFPSAARSPTSYPKEGGKRITGSFYTDYSTAGFQSNNLTPELRALGLKDATRIDFPPVGFQPGGRAGR